MTPSTPATPTAPLRLGIVGTGLALQQLHWPALRQLTDRVSVVAFADTASEAAGRFAATAGLGMDAYHPDYRDLLARADVDAVLILLPIPLLYDAARAALVAGKHVFCEKPPGGDLDQGRAFLRLESEFPGRVLFVAENFFYRDDLRLARSLLDGGVIGRLNVMAWRQAGQYVPRAGGFSSTPWRQQPAYRGGPHLDGGVHMIAQIRLLCGDVRRVHGLVQYANSTMGGPSDLTLNLAFVSGAIGNYTAVNAEIPVPREEHGLRLYGSEGVMVFSGAYGRGVRTVAVYRPDGAVREHRVEGGDGGYYNEWLDFCATVAARAAGNGERRPVGTVAQSFTNMLVVLRGLDSAEGEGEVDLAPDAPQPLVERPVPLWRPDGDGGLFDHLPVTVGEGEGVAAGGGSRPGA
jgi:predicted dehydrogenase